MNEIHKIATPGDVLGTTEEYIPGEGTYEEEGKIYASVPGQVFVDEKDLRIDVRTKNPTIKLLKGDHVIARVIGLYESMVLVEIVMVDGIDRSIAGGDTTAVIHVSKIDRRYTEDVKNEYRIGDIIRAEVIQAEPSPKLVTNYPHLGVIRALCTKCRFPMEKGKGALVCTNCENRETRKLADDFGNVQFDREG
ncbi:MAG: exosome complex RNA-binding protein Csl4 [Candidatus Thermoplasmatota archaeon]|nr:exosome complex RNA-binding protein Csl4 [Candidatus Thermoplasmatota archaeon]